MTAMLVVDQPNGPAGPGEACRIPVRVKNTSQVVDVYRFEVLGDTAACAEVLPAQLSLFPGQEGEAQLLVRLPADTRLIGTVPIGLKMTSGADGAATHV